MMGPHKKVTPWVPERDSPRGERFMCEGLTGWVLKDEQELVRLRRLGDKDDISKKQSVV